MAEAVERSRRAVEDVWLGLRRLSRCRPFGGHGYDPGPAHVDPLHGTQGFHRHLVVVRRAVRLSGALRAAAEAGRRRRRARRNGRPLRLPPQATAPVVRATTLEQPEPAGADLPRPSEREIVVETTTSEVVLTQSWRPDSALATEGLSRQRRATRRSGAVECSAGSTEAVLAGRRRRSIDASAQRRALSRDRGRRRARRRDEAAGHAVVRISGRCGAARSQGLPIRSEELRGRVLGERDERRASAQPDDRLGPRLGRRGRDEPAAAVSSPETTFSRRRRSITRTGASSASTATSVVEQPAHEGAFRFAGIDDHYFLAAAVESRQRATRVQARDAARSGQDAASAPGAVVPISAAAEGRPLLRRAEAVRRAAVGRPGARARDLLRHVRVSRRAAPDRVEMGVRIRRQLRAGRSSFSRSSSTW